MRIQLSCLLSKVSDHRKHATLPVAKIGKGLNAMLELNDDLTKRRIKSEALCTFDASHNRVDNRAVRKTGTTSLLIRNPRLPRNPASELPN
ncbi:hypothetical protein C8J98_1158 [Luteibacter sp. OK325]|nr:hypothetical protein C8J98_1158 [Luteibacter sp. OK325]